MRYEQIERMSRSDADAALTSGDRDRTVRAIIASAMYDSDWRWVQRKCVELVKHSDVWVRRACGTALLHVARIHRRLDMNLAMQVLNVLSEDRDTAGEASDTLEEIRVFLGTKNGGSTPMS